MRYVYIGRRTNNKNKLSHFYEAEGDPNDTLGFKRKIFGHEAVGGIIDITFAEDGKFYVSGEHAPTYCGKLDDPEAIAEMLAEEKIAIINDEGRKLANADSRMDELDSLIDPLKEVVSKQVGYGRKVALVQYITNRLYS